MRAADREPGGAAGLQRRAVQREAARLERVGHPLGPRRAVAAEALQLGEEPGVGVVDAVAEDMEVFVVAVDGRQLGGGDDANRAAGRVGGRQRLGDAVDRVVVAEREQLDARGGRAGDDLGRRQRAVRARRVRLQVERRAGGHRCGPYPPGPLRARWRPSRDDPTTPSVVQSSLDAASALWRRCCARREARAGPSPPLSPSATAATTSGSNCVPAQRRSSASATSSGRASRYGRSEVIACSASQTATIRAGRGIASPRRPSG